MLFLQDVPANTTSYMIAGYAVIFGMMLIYLVSLLVRQRNLNQDLEVMQDLEGGENESGAGSMAQEGSQ